MENANSPTVLTLDAGGTNFVFSAFRDFQQVAAPVTLPAHGDDLQKSLANLVEGFQRIARTVGDFKAISFAFPGPANYELGIIGNLPNFKAYNGGVALGPMLQHKFAVPVFINNDGDLFASGVYKRGYLPLLNARLRDAGSTKQYNTVIGLTLGTGLGCGIVCDGRLVTGDNSCGAEIHNTLNPFNSEWNAEESVSTRAIQRVYAEASGTDFNNRLYPKDIYDIALGKKDGDRKAAYEAFAQYGKALGLTICNVMTLVDGIVVIGGGIAAAWDLISPHVFASVNRPFYNPWGEKNSRLSYKVFNLQDPFEFAAFVKGSPETIPIPGTDMTMEYDAAQRSGIALSNLEASFAISLGAYEFALQKLNQSR